MNPNYLLPISETMQAAWDKVKGAKGSIWAAIGLVFLILFIAGFIDGILTEIVPKIEPLYGFILQIFGFLLQMGFIYLGIQRAKDLPISYRLVFRAFEGRIGIYAIALYILQIIILILPLLAIIGGVALLFTHNLTLQIIAGLIILAGACLFFYVTVRIVFSMAFVLDSITGPWEAIKQSFAITRNNFWRLCFLYFLQILIFLGSVLTLGIAFIWTLPFMIILYGVCYKNLSQNLL